MRGTQDLNEADVVLGWYQNLEPKKVRSRVVGRARWAIQPWEELVRKASEVRHLLH